MKKFQYSSKEERIFFKETKKNLKNKLKNGDSVYVVFPPSVTVDKTPNGMEIYEDQGVYYHCIVGKDNYGNLIATNCEYLKGDKINIEEGELLRHLVGADFLINKVEKELP